MQWIRNSFFLKELQRNKFGIKLEKIQVGKAPNINLIKKEASP